MFNIVQRWYILPPAAWCFADKKVAFFAAFR